jgi:hypothetical protein
MERLVRSHPCNIMLTYINEPFPNVKNKPHRHLTRPELTEFFKGADIAVKLNNPDLWGSVLAAAEKRIGEGALVLCQVSLAGRCGANPVAAEFAERLLRA